MSVRPAPKPQTPYHYLPPTLFSTPTANSTQLTTIRALCHCPEEQTDEIVSPPLIRSDHPSYSS